MYAMPAAFATELEGKRVRCGLCPPLCLLAPGDMGTCRTRRNEDGKLMTLIYGRLLANAVDPIEKKPLFHFYPGSRSLSVATAGCNLVCPFCQNYGLSQRLRCADTVDVRGRVTAPAEVVEAATQSGAKSISFTYSEPILQFEFVRDVAPLAQEAGVELAFVSNGQIQKDPCKELAGLVSAANIDLKAFLSESYKDVLGGSLKSTLRTIELLASSGVWVEVTTLVIPRFNDSEQELRKIAAFIAGVSKDIPWHVSRFHPDYEWTDRGPTSWETLQKAREIGLAEGLKYVYTGNMLDADGESTFCPSCKEVVLSRRGFNLERVAVVDGCCAHCKAPIAGVGMETCQKK